MPFRASFDCLWCGRPHTTREPDDLEGWAQLCPDCLGRAGDNAFLRFRLRQALAERAAGPRPVSGARAAAGETAAPSTPAAPAVLSNPPPAAPSGAIEPAVDDEEDWLLRRGRFAHGPIHDAAWSTELDAAGRWLDGLPLGGRILELGAAAAWWAPLLATRGELTVIGAPAALDRTRERLLAHGLRAHLHEGDPWSPPVDEPADAAVVGFGLGGLDATSLAGRLAGIREHLREGGLLATLDALAEPRVGGVDGAPGPAAALMPDALTAALERAGFRAVRVETTGRFFVLGRATP